MVSLYLFSVIYWYSFLNDPQNTGVFPLDLAKTNNYIPIVKWVREIPLSRQNSPVIGDVDNDGEVEVVVASKDGNVYRLKGENGDAERIFPMGTPIYTAPSIDNLDNDPAIEIAVGAMDEKVYIIDGNSFQAEWTSDELDGVIVKGPTIFDVDKNGTKELIVGTAEPTPIAGREPHKVWCFTNNNSATSNWQVKWSRELGDEIGSYPACDDVDGDGTIEVIITTYKERVYCLDGNTGNIEWSYLHPGGGQVMFTSSPVIKDVDGDGNKEVVAIVYDARDLIILDGRTGNYKRGYSFSGETSGTPAAHDVDNDGEVEILCTTVRPAYLHCINGRTGTREWFYNMNDKLCYDSPVCVDITNDKVHDVVVCSHTGFVHALLGSGTVLWNNFNFQSDLEGAVACGVLDNDGCLDIVAGGYKYERWQRHCVFALEFQCPVGIEEEEKEREKFYFISCKNRLIGKYNVGKEQGKIEIYNIVGEKVREYEVKGKGEIEIKNLRKGIYFGKIRVKERYFTVKGIVF
jgi:outer membrane protein assembly factor BamB